MSKQRSVTKRSYCKKPDRDVPGIICGYPLPCPYHTAIIHADKDPATIEIPATLAPDVSPKVLKRLKQIGRMFEEDKVK